MTSVGLREQKKLRTRRAISDTALRLFAERGFDAVSVAEVAEAANVSRRTLFAYFPTKEDLIVQRIADHEDEAGRVVRERPRGDDALAALRNHFLDAIRRHDPVTGCSDNPQALDLYRLLLGTPSLASRRLDFLARGEDALTQALVDEAGVEPLTASLVAAQVVVVQSALAERSFRSIVEGRTADEVEPEALGAAALGFQLLRDGAGRM